MVKEQQALEHGQRVNVQMELTPHGRRVKIRTESHDEGLGWYTSGSLTLPLHQLPLLEQAVAEMRRQSLEAPEFAQIIPFPGLPAEAHSAS